MRSFDWTCSDGRRAARSSTTSASSEGFTTVRGSDSVSDAKQSLEQIAAEVFGAPTSIEVAVADESPREATQSPLRDDPIMQAFKKHLGGEIVEARKAK